MYGFRLQRVYRMEGKSWRVWGGLSGEKAALDVQGAGGKVFQTLDCRCRNPVIMPESFWKGGVEWE